RVCVPAVCMVSAVGCLFLLAAYIHAAGVVMQAQVLKNGLFYFWKPKIV
ncbi:hypothetical protein Tco_0718093, partial [Tanacetum coccineum]